MDKRNGLLASLKIPPPAPEARENALQLAMEAFDRAQTEKKIKGTGPATRPIGQKPPTKGEGPMTRIFSPIVVKTAKWGAVCALLLAGVSLIVPDFIVYRSAKAPMRNQQPIVGPPAQPSPPTDLPTPSGPAVKDLTVAVPPLVASTEELMATVPPSRETANLKMALEPGLIGPPPAEYVGRDRFAPLTPNPVKRTAEEPVSTFSIDVDTASYAFVRRALNNGTLPPKNAVRIEEMVNYFPYAYPLPKDRATPFKPTVAVFPTPWNRDTQLVHIGIKGYAMEADSRPRANLVFLVDVSGSMQGPDRLPLLKNALRLLVEHLSPEDSVALVTYAGRAGIALEPTRAKDKAKILAAIDALEAGGSTAGAEGIVTAYDLAQAHFDPKGINRILLATDGDFNVGISDPEQLKGFVERKRRSGIFLSVLGFGQGNFNDALMQALAQNGNGNAATIDTLNEARKVLVEEASATLFTIAKDVKIQVEFNPAVVAEYRLIGYETRLLRREDFNNDQVDAGEVGAGHSVTAIYEITPAGGKARLVDDLRYGGSPPAPGPDTSGEVGFLKIRYKSPDADTSRLISQPIDRSMVSAALDKAPADARFAAAVAAFGQLLRGDPHTGQFSYDDVIRLAQPVRGDDPFGYRSEFVNLVRLAKTARAMGER